MRVARALLVVGTLLLGACADSSSTRDTTAPAATTPPSEPDRPYDVFTPTSYRDGTPMPLVIMLHGLGSNGVEAEGYLQLQPLAESEGFLAVHPEGTLLPSGSQFWDATDACCGDGNTSDDVGFLVSIIDEVSASHDVDPSRVFVVGHSNGGFMSYRAACDAADRIAAIVSVAGATWADPAKCAPTEPVSVLHIHGTDDEAVVFDGGSRPGAAEYPSAATTVATWAGYNGCGDVAIESGRSIDFDAAVPGNETTATTFDGCPDGIAVELWTLQDGSHLPRLQFPDGSQPMSEAMIGWLFAHPKP